MMSSRISSSRGSTEHPAPDAGGLAQAQAHHSEKVVHPLLVVRHDAHVGGGTIASLQAHHAAAQCVQAADLHHLQNASSMQAALIQKGVQQQAVALGLHKSSCQQVLLRGCSSPAHQSGLKNMCVLSEQ